MQVKSKKTRSGGVAYEVTTPAGVAQWPRLDRPDEKYNDYSVKLILDPNEPAVAEFMEFLDELQGAALEAAKAEFPGKGRQVPKAHSPANQPYTDELDKEGEPTGRIVFLAKRKASGTTKEGKEWSTTVPKFDAKGKPAPVDLAIYSGSVLKLSVELSTFANNAIGHGISRRLNAVQVLELVTGGARSAAGYGFGEEEGFEADDAPAPSKRAAPAEDDEAPFDTDGEGGGGDEPEEF